MPRYQIDKFLEEKKEWIQTHITNIQKKKSTSTTKKDQIMLYGEVYTILHNEKSKETIIDQDTKTITSNLNLTHRSTQTQRLKQYAKEILTTQIQELSRKHNCSFNALYIRDQKTKRGTCSSKKNIWLNRKLIKMPPAIAEYVICHELAHLKEMNHSQHFRSHLDTLYPDRKKAVRWLKDNGMTLE